MMLPLDDQRLSAESYAAVTNHLYRRLSEDMEIAIVRVPRDVSRHIKERVAADGNGQPPTPPAPAEPMPAVRDLGLWPVAAIMAVAVVLILWHG